MIFLLPYLQVLTSLNSVLRRLTSPGYKEPLCAAEHTLRHISPQSIPYWLADATTVTPGDDLEVRQLPTLSHLFPFPYTISLDLRTLLFDL
jgi:hypothetical protein